MCAFDLLATVADNLLQEKQNPTTSSDRSSEKDGDGFPKEERQDANKPFKTELSDEASCDRKCQLEFVKEGSSNANSFKVELSDEGSSDRKCFSNISSQVYNQNCCSKELPEHEIDGHLCIASIVTSSSCSEKIVAETLVDGKGHNGMEKLASKVELGSCGYLESRGCKLDGDVSKVKDDKFGKVPIDTGTGLCCFEDTLDEKPLALISSCGNAKMSGYDDSMPQSSWSKGCDNVLVDSRDDDENFSGCAHPSTKIKSFRPITCIDDRKTKKRLASKHHKVSQESKHDILSNSVKLRIKSFRVPELFIEIPETATVGSLKRTVMEAVTAVLGGGLRVGVILHGKKVRDDSKTLLQTGISHDNHLDALGFALEPNCSRNRPSACATTDSLHIPSADMPQPLIGYPSSPAVIHQRIQGFSNMLAKHQATSSGNLVESDHDSAPSPINTSGEKYLSDSKELITVPEMGMEALAVLPVHQKSKRTEIAQRRIRRPFSVTEVEALVQAVEKLGTGRWRDVKLRAFDNAKHRTYVDLKDKWKTLVHTARISAQQRRGEPVPQELLDRVLTAHAYWSQQQTKQQLKHHSTKPCLLL
ncbi:hypothetical protein JHK85_038794 [Glycine max]|nr:hypothetical protein JHK85_038794 [Glycine max]